MRHVPAALLIASVLEPTRSAHARAFEMDTGSTVDEFVARYAPGDQG